ncbi:15-hydroxyprostaglandin dehydrogenase [NAD(+)] [Leptinotarsa decemlineata]|uniref:15-hydroxyprostaglandin dehydrogenase [NAD(+)] n=1 Tax=Leptinotarsa decemlineata TaxID=7539 RepID=UPI000C2535DF|nr:15-hydroxyprostaglandin dehydrogenase [NAD(+)]-like [Leptinotarsa decemlineata]
MSLVSNIRPTSRIPLKYVGRHSPRVNTINHNTKHHPALFSKTPYSKKSVVCKVALITGGVRGIGYNIAEGLLDVGTKAVIFGDAKTEDCKEAVCKLNEKYGEPRAFFQTCDISKKSDLEKLFKTVKEKFNKIDFVVNNADIDEEWDKTMYVNLNGLVRGTLLGFKYMGAQSGGKGGYIINVSSILGLQPFFASPIYSGTKHFGIGFSRSMGDKYFYDRSKVKVMTLCPSITNTTKNRKDGLPEFKDLASDGARSIRRLTSQDPSEIGKGLLTMLEDAENGSVWVSEGKDFYKARIPDRRTLRLSTRPGGTAGDCGKENPCKVKVPKKKKDKCEKEVKKAPCDRDNPCRRQNNTCK